MRILRTTIAYGSCLTHHLYANMSVTMSLMACALHPISMHASSTTIADGPCLTGGRKCRVKSIEYCLFYGEAMAFFFPWPSKRSYGTLEDNYRLWLVPHTLSVCQLECNYITDGLCLTHLSMHASSITVADGLCLAHRLYAHLEYNCH
jgi:hypothetical protein